MTNNLTRNNASPIIYPLYLKLIAFGNAGFGEWFLSWRNNYFFFHAELTNWEMIILIICLCIWYRILYSNTILKFPLIISAKGVGGQMWERSLPFSCFVCYNMGSQLICGIQINEFLLHHPVSDIYLIFVKTEMKHHLMNNIQYRK